MAFQKLTDARAQSVVLVGPSGEGYSCGLGRYDRQEEMVCSRHVYRTPDGEYSLWWAHLTRKTTSASQLSLTDAQALIALFDTNADGELDFGEFVAAVAGGDVRV